MSLVCSSDEEVGRVILNQILPSSNLGMNSLPIRVASAKAMMTGMIESNIALRAWPMTQTTSVRPSRAAVRGEALGSRGSAGAGGAGVAGEPVGNSGFAEIESQPFDIHEVIDGLVDQDSFFELKPLYAAELVTGFGRMAGRDCSSTPQKHTPSRAST